MIAPLELNHLLPFGIRPHQPYHTHTRLRTRIRKPNHFHGRHGVNHHLGQLVFQRAGGAERRAFIEGGFHRGDDVRVSVAEDGGAPRADVVDVFVPVHVEGVGARDAVEHDGRAAHGFEGADGRGDASRHQRLRLRENFFALGKSVHFIRHGTLQRTRRCCFRIETGNTTTGGKRPGTTQKSGQCDSQLHILFKREIRGGGGRRRWTNLTKKSDHNCYTFTAGE
mmetsp:Transcript_31624/g.38692  ORF Transcript_31624/g.38692 Transcript_31624/m.38692 type:complete len:224 (-) Transcript_31624:31-702(-)